MRNNYKLQAAQGIAYMHVAMTTEHQDNAAQADDVLHT